MRLDSLIQWVKCVEVREKLAKILALGDPTAVLATLAAIFLAFLPLHHTPKNDPFGDFLHGAASGELSPWDNFPDSWNTQEMTSVQNPLFPYSVIPGGVRSAEELKNAIAQDPTVAEHYAGFDLAKTHAVRAETSQLVYVSYRIGNSVFWTKKPLRIAQGEALITDGEHTARTRCGNRLSDVPVGPVSPEEPTEEAMERVQDSELLAINTPPPAMPLTPPPTTDIPPSTTRRIFIPPIIPIWWGGGTPPGGIPVTPPPPPPLATPEPETLLMLSTGLSALWLLRRRRKS
jgi:hypothetical protein